MNAATTYTITTTAATDTLRFGERLATLLPEGAIIELVSDLGGGKTTLVQGLAHGLGYEGDVTSPTFTLSRIYQLPHGRELHHFDLYRLAGADTVATELNEIAGSKKVITAIEWPETAPLDLPSDRLTVTITPTGETGRSIMIAAGGAQSQRVIEGLQR